MSGSARVGVAMSINSARSVPPVDTGKVRIGLAYIPRYRWKPDADDLYMQTVLLPRGPRSGLRARLVGVLPGVALWVVLVFLILVLLGLGVSR